jgi:hypothetical protein
LRAGPTRHPPVPPVLYTPLGSFTGCAGVLTLLLYHRWGRRDPDPKGPVLPCCAGVPAEGGGLPLPFTCRHADTRLRPCRVEGAPQLAVWLSRKQE